MRPIIEGGMHCDVPAGGTALTSRDLCGKLSFLDFIKKISRLPTRSRHYN